MIEHIELSQRDKDQLIRLKRRTGIENWNVLCRWAFCTSLATEGVPPDTKVLSDSNVEMTWRVFGGQHHYAYEALLRTRCVRDGLGVDPDVLTRQFRLHLSRGIGYLAAGGSVRSIADLVKLPMSR